MAVEKLCYLIYFLGSILFGLQNLCFIHILCSCCSNSRPIYLFSVVFLSKTYCGFSSLIVTFLDLINPLKIQSISTLTLFICIPASELSSCPLFLKLISFGELGLSFPRWVLLLLGTPLELLPIPMEKLVLCLIEWTAQALASL
jgi:hypothetical protein